MSNTHTTAFGYTHTNTHSKYSHSHMKTQASMQIQAALLLYPNTAFGHTHTHTLKILTLPYENAGPDASTRSSSSLHEPGTCTISGSSERLLLGIEPARAQHMPASLQIGGSESQINRAGSEGGDIVLTTSNRTIPNLRPGSDRNQEKLDTQHLCEQIVVPALVAMHE
jgi:hypothetical protein